MKRLLKKLSVFITFSLLLIFTACQNGNKQQFYPTAKLVNIENGATDVDPASVNYIDIKFDRAMDTQYGGFIYYSGCGDDILDCRWINTYTYRFILDLRYDSSFKIVFNDDSFLTAPNNTGTYTRSSSYLRDIDGNYLKTFPIEFSTIASSIQHPHDFVISIPTYSVQMTENEYWDNNQNVRINIKPLLNHEVLKAGDTVTIKYKVWSPYNVEKVYAQLCDLLANNKDGFQILNKQKEDGDIVIPSLKATTDPNNPIYYEGEYKFEIETGMANSSLSIEIGTDYFAEDENSELISLNFVDVE